MKSWALFGQAEYTFADLPVSISGEVRYAEDEVGGSVLTLRTRLAEPETDFTEPPKRFTNLPWGVTVSYKFQDGIGDLFEEALAYAKVATSYRHGGLNAGAGSPGLDRYPRSPPSRMTSSGWMRSSDWKPIDGRCFCAAATSSTRITRPGPSARPHC